MGPQGAVAESVATATGLERSPDDEAVNLRLACVHLLVRDLERAAHFYTRSLGFRISAKRAGACYLTSGGAQHEVALFEYAPEGAAPPLAIGCRSIGFQVSSKAALARLCERLGGARVTALDDGATWAIHTTDPDGNRIKVFCETSAHGVGLSEGGVRTLSTADLRAARDEVLA